MIERLHRRVRLPFSIDTSPMINAMSIHGLSGGFLQSVINQDDFDPTLSLWLSDLGLKINFGEVFRTGPMSETTIHVDGPAMDESCKLNWAFGASGSTMAWWRITDPSMDLAPRSAPGGTKYIRIETSGCQMLHSEGVGSPSLVNVGIPHNIINPTNQPRWCISYMLGKTDVTQNLQWTDAIEVLGPWLDG
jgi:hypothetical protein